VRPALIGADGPNGGCFGDAEHARDGVVPGPMLLANDTAPLSCRRLDPVPDELVVHPLTEGGAPRKIRTPRCLSYHPRSPLTTEEIVARARDRQ
jgi:hypothetical protein